MLVLAPTEIKQKQLHLEASRLKSQDGWASSPSSSHPHTLRASLFPGTRVEVLGVPWRAKCLDFFIPRLWFHCDWFLCCCRDGRAHAWYTCIRWKGEMLFHETHTYSALYLFWESGKGVFAWIHLTKKNLSGRCFYILIIIMLFCIFHHISCHFLPPVLLVFLACPWLVAVTTCVSSLLPDSFHLCRITLHLVVSLLMLLCH